MSAAEAWSRLDEGGDRQVHRRAAAVLRMAEASKTGERRASVDAEAGDDARLLERCKQKDLTAFRELYARHARQVASQLVFLVPSHEVEDALQDVFIEVFRSLHRFEGRSAFSTWLYRVAVHVAMKSRRKSARAKVDVRLIEDPDAPDPAPGPTDTALTRERLARVEALLEHLSPKKRTVLVLHDLRGVEAQRIAELTGSNILTVRTRLFYARREFEKLAANDPTLAEFFAGEGEGA